MALGDPPSPTALEITAGSLMTSPAGSAVSNTSYQQQTPSKRIPGKLALCNKCGTQSEDLATCIRCKRKLPDDVKLLDDPAFKPKPDSTLAPAGDKNKALRGVRMPNKNRKRNNADEPVCIALSDSEEEAMDLDDTETVEDSQGKWDTQQVYSYFGVCFDNIRVIEADGRFVC